MTKAPFPLKYGILLIISEGSRSNLAGHRTKNTAYEAQNFLQLLTVALHDCQKRVWGIEHLSACAKYICLTSLGLLLMLSWDNQLSTRRNSLSRSYHVRDAAFLQLLVPVTYRWHTLLLRDEGQRVQTSPFLLLPSLPKLICKLGWINVFKKNMRGLRMDLS